MSFSHLKLKIDQINQNGEKKNVWKTLTKEVLSDLIPGFICYGIFFCFATFAIVLLHQEQRTTGCLFCSVNILHLMLYFCGVMKEF